MAPRVLVVEDDAGIRELLAELLREENFPAVTAANGEDALAHLEGRDGPWIVLLDLRLPGVDGREVLRRLRADPRHERTPVLLLSAEADLAEFGRDPAVNVLGKPFELPDLLAWVDEAASRVV